MLPLAQVTTEAQREGFGAALAAAEDWLYGEGEGEAAPAFKCARSSPVPRVTWRTRAWCSNGTVLHGGSLVWGQHAVKLSALMGSGGGWGT